MDESSELAVGLHAGNNIFGAVMVSFPSSVFQMPTVFRTTEIDFVFATFMWFLAAVVYFLVMARIYKWNDYAKLWRTLEPVTSQPEAEPSALEINSP